MKCSVCGETITAQEEIPALGHDDADGDGKCDVCEEDLGKDEEEVTHPVINNTGNVDKETWTFTEEVTGEGEDAQTTKTVTVTHENACMVVVAVQNDDGTHTYTRVEAQANDDGSYDFDVSDMPEGASVVIAQKGDINLDYQLDISDILACVYGFTSNGSDGYELSALEALIADTNNDNIIDISDILALVYAFTGTALNW